MTPGTTDEPESTSSLTEIKANLLQLRQGERTPAQLQAAVNSVNKLEDLISDEALETSELLPIVIETFNTEIHHEYTSPAFEKSRYGSELGTGLARCLYAFAVSSPDEFDGQIRPLVDALEPADEEVSELLLTTLVELVPVAGAEIATETEPLLQTIEYNQGSVRFKGLKLLALIAASTSAVATTVLERIEIYDPLTNGWAAILESVVNEERIPPTAIDKLVDGLYADSDVIRVQAAKGLGDLCAVARPRVPTAVVLDALENGLYDTNAEVRSAVIEAHQTLVTQRSLEVDRNRVINLLVQSLEDESEEVQRATATVLRELATTGDPQSDVVIQDLLSRIDSTALEQESIREALGQIARTTSTYSLGHQIIYIFVERVQETDDFFDESDNIFTDLERIANNAQTEEIAVTAVWALLTLLRAKSRTDRESAAEQLGSIGTFPTPYATRAVIDALDEQLRSESIFGQETTAEALAQIIISSDEKQSPIAERALSKLQTALTSTDGSIASAAAVGLATVAGTTGADGAALDILTTVLQSEEKSHQRTSIEALGIVAVTGDPRPQETACDILFTALGDPEIRAEAAAALLGEHTTDRPDLSHDEFRRVLAALEPATAPPTVCESVGEFAAAATSRTIADEAFDFLVQAVENSDEFSRSRVIEALGRVCTESAVFDTSRGVTALESMFNRYGDPEVRTTIVSELETLARETEASPLRILEIYKTQINAVSEETRTALANSICRVTAETGEVDLSLEEFELIVEAVDFSTWENENVAAGLATAAIEGADPGWETQVAELFWDHYESGDELDRQELMTGAGKLAIHGQTDAREEGFSILLEGVRDDPLVRSAATEQLSEFANQHAGTVDEATLFRLFRGLKTTNERGSVGPVFCEGVSAIASETQTKDVGTAAVDLLSQTLAARGEVGGQAGRELATIAEQASVAAVGELALERLAIATRFRSLTPDSEESQSRTVAFGDDSIEVHGWGFDEELEHLHDPFAYLNALKGFATLASLNPDRCTPFVSDIREILTSIPYQAPDDHPMVQMIDAYVVEILHQLPSTATISATMTQQPGGRRPFRWNFV